jgi:hypothetical protein
VQSSSLGNYFYPFFYLIAKFTWISYFSSTAPFRFYGSVRSVFFWGDQQHETHHVIDLYSLWWCDSLYDWWKFNYNLPVPP